MLLSYNTPCGQTKKTARNIIFIDLHYLQLNIHWFGCVWTQNIRIDFPKKITSRPWNLIRLEDDYVPFLFKDTGPIFRVDIREVSNEIPQMSKNPNLDYLAIFRLYRGWKVPTQFY